MARHPSRDDRDPAVADPDPPTPRLEQRNTARDHTVCRRFRARSSPAEASSLQRAARRLTPHHPVRPLVALSDLDAPEAVARAMEEAWVYAACSSE